MLGAGELLLGISSVGSPREGVQTGGILDSSNSRHGSTPEYIVWYSRVHVLPEIVFSCLFIIVRKALL